MRKKIAVYDIIITITASDWLLFIAIDYFAQFSQSFFCDLSVAVKQLRIHGRDLSSKPDEEETLLTPITADDLCFLKQHHGC